MTSALLTDIRHYISGGAPAGDTAEPATPTPQAEVATPVENNVAPTDSDSIGFFDEELDSKKDNKPYGIFADDDNGTGAAYGFFDEDLEASAQNYKDTESVSSNSDDNFGFFEDVEEVKPDAKLEEEKKVQSAPKSQTPAKAVPPKAEPGKKRERSGGAAREKKASSANNNIRVNLDKIDLLMNNVGDLVITNAMLTQFATTIEETKTRASVLERLELLERHIREMQDSIMSIRMVPMESIYSKFPKVVRDISKKLGKKVEFKHYGDGVEIDKAMIEGLTDPLMHIIRNSLDHGLETPDERESTGKDQKGSIIISAEQANGQMIITIEDDGRGIDSERVAQKALENGQIDENQLNQMSNNDKAMLIFGAGLSTAEKITDISGRGVGMDVVKTNINKLGGVIKLDTELGVGTTITIMLPLTLAILDGLDIAVGDRKYILPLSAIVESLQPTSDMIKKIGDGTQDLLMLREEFIPVVRLHQLFDVEPKYEELENGMLIVVKSGNMKVAIFIDEFLHQHQVVVKPLDKNFRSVEGVGAATVRGDGSIGLILDVLGIIDAQKKVEKDIIATKRAS
jgi:two-component system chemotaxis sensor kinase CheA